MKVLIDWEIFCCFWGLGKLLQNHIWSLACFCKAGELWYVFLLIDFQWNSIIVSPWVCTLQHTCVGQKADAWSSFPPTFTWHGGIGWGHQAWFPAEPSCWSSFSSIEQFIYGMSLSNFFMFPLLGILNLRLTVFIKLAILTCLSQCFLIWL